MRSDLKIRDVLREERRTAIQAGFLFMNVLVVLDVIETTECLKKNQESNGPPSREP